MQKSVNGFTIVELLIAIVVIGILAGITVTAFSGVQRRAYNATRISEIYQWEKSFQMYKSLNGSFPANPSTASGYCMGVGFPLEGTCGDLYYAANSYKENAALMNEIATVSSLPTSPRDKLVNNSAIGPYVHYTAEWISFVAVLDLPGDERCSDFSLLEMYRAEPTGISFCGIQRER